MPERLVPGIRASTWARPMNRIPPKVVCSIRCRVIERRSTAYRRTPKTIEAQAITSTVRSMSITPNRSPRKPATTTGIVPTTSNRNRRPPAVMRKARSLAKPPIIRPTSRQKYSMTANRVPTWTAMSRISRSPPVRAVTGTP